MSGRVGSIMFVPPEASAFVADPDAALAQVKTLFELILVYVSESVKQARLRQDAMPKETLAASLTTLWPDFKLADSAFDPSALADAGSGLPPELVPAPAPELFRRSLDAASAALGPALGYLIRYVVKCLEAARSSRAAETQWALRQFAMKVDIIFDSKVYEQTQ